MIGRLVFLAVCCLTAWPCWADEELDARQEAAVRAAVTRVAPAVVRIETVGGLDRVGGLLFGEGPTTGIVIDPAGYIVSSAFNFVNRPTSILVRLADGTRKPAKLIATDQSRMVVLLKIESDQPLDYIAPKESAEGKSPLSEIVPVGQMRVGQWTIALGRTFDADMPNMTLGILSALDRVWGKAIQTDAAVSPNNYGGPLIDIHGRVLGLLVPLSPEATDELAGVEWYDSGIGFAVPMQHIFDVLLRLKNGEDLYPGLLGAAFQGSNLYTGAPLVAACRPKSPAAQAGLRSGDRVVEIEGRPISRIAEVKQELGRRYAGDTVRMVALRGNDRLDFQVCLAAKLEPFQHGFVGILPMRSPNENGVAVRYVYPDSPAAAAGIEPGDTIVALQGEPIADRMELLVKLSTLEPGTEVELDVSRAGVKNQYKIVLGELPEGLPPAELPPASSSESKSKSQGTELPPLGEIKPKIPEFANEVFGYVPEGYQVESSYGVVVWLHGDGGFDWPELLARWKPLCNRYDLILLAPRSSDPARWTPGESVLIDRLLAEIAVRYNVDATRVVVHGYESGGRLAFLAAQRNRAAVRGVAAVEAQPPTGPWENEPLMRLAVYAAWANQSRLASPIKEAIVAMRKNKLSVTEKSLGDMPRYLNADELAELARWIDMLDRM